ncbi:MAG: radical SAM protein [Anaerolineales bacterium]|nr:MAG: radical SAM protein [Anaerolineales bacterium]
MKIMSCRTGYATDHSSSTYEFYSLDQPTKEQKEADVQELAERLIEHRFLSIGETHDPLPLPPVNVSFVHRSSSCASCPLPPTYLSAPTTVHLSLTEACNLDCPACYVLKSKDPPLNTSQVEQLINELAEIKVFQLAMGGGEPFLRNDLGHLVRYARQRGLVPNVTTNGTLLTRERLAEIKGSVGQIQLSLNGYDAESHETHRTPGSFEKTLSAMRLLREMDVAFGVNILVTRGSDFSRTARLAVEQGARQVNALRPKPAANDTEWFHRYSPLPKEFIKLRRELDRLTLEYPEVRFTVDSALVFLMGDLTNDELQAHAIYGCDAGVRSIAVRANGQVYPCSQFSDREFCAGDVTEAGLGSIWREAAVLWRFREMTPKLKGRCSICNVRDYCKGCRRIAYFVTGDFYAKDPGCLQAMSEQAAIGDQAK